MKISIFKREFNVWSAISIIILGIVLIPSFVMLFSIFLKPSENWVYVKENLIVEPTINTIIILFFTGIFSTIIGTTLAYIVNIFKFPFSRFFKWALILPLSIPSYIAAYTYSGMVDFTGSITKFLKSITGEIILIDIMSIPGVIFIFTLFLFPYVYIIVNSFFDRQAASFIEVARTMGKSQIEIFLQVFLPLARIPIISGLSFILIEVLNDYGVFNYFGIPSLSTVVFRVWFSLGDIDSAMKLGNYLLIVLVFILIIEFILRGRKKYSITNTKIKPINKVEIKGIGKWVAFSYVFLIFSFGFLIPVIQLLFWAFKVYDKVLNSDFWILVLNSFSLTFICSIVIIIFSVIIINSARLSKDRFLSGLSKITIMGYSIPASVLAMAILTFFIFLDRSLKDVYILFGITNKTLVLSTSVIMLGFAYIIRFLSIGCNSIESGFEKIGNKFTEVSRTLGNSITKTFFKVDLKMISPAIFAGISLVFIDMLKELPLTLILRPFGFNTLSTKVYEYAHDERIIDASIPALIIILISAISIYYFYNFHIRKEEN